MVQPDSVVYSKQMRRARPITGGQVNPERILSWLHACQKFHGETCKPESLITPAGRPTTSPIDHFRGIDVVDGCIIEAPNACKYMALSYVWGQGPMFKRTAENLGVLAQLGTLREVATWNYTPQTIRDAIDPVQQLREKMP